MEEKKHEIWALCALIITLLVFFSLISFHSSDLTAFNASSTERAPRNWIGFFGANVAWFLLFLLGLGAYAIPAAGLWLSWILFHGKIPSPQNRFQFPGIILMFGSIITLASIHLPRISLGDQQILTGGQLGLMLQNFFVSQFYLVGAHILLVGTFLIALIIATPLSIASSCQVCIDSLTAAMKNIRKLLLERGNTVKPSQPATPTQSVQEQPPVPEVHGPEPPRQSKPVLKTRPKEEPSLAVERIAPPPAPVMKVAKKEPSSPALPPKLIGQYALPGIDLLDTYEEEDRGPDWKKLEADARVLEEKLADFGVQGKVVDISPGPVITMYEYTPAPGIKISRIVGLSDDLSMALKAMSIRVVAPIPGKAAIGIEIPNQHRKLVSIQTVIESEAFTGSSSHLTIALGKDITGRPVVANLAKMPHLLIAGATGTGKSVCINTVLSSLLFRNTPDDIRLLLIDPKRIELSSYEGVPQLIHPVVTDAKMATRALKWAVQEMELRYRLLADKNVRNIEGYNKALAREKIQSSKPPQDANDEPTLKHHRLPYLVIIIDELADLMMVASREVEESITRLAQMARAAGIHLILATQRPSVDVLTGVIKANIPTRISFQVSSRVDSRTILDGMGAENLLGSGDMLFLPPGTAKLQRIHGAFISESEVQRLTDFWRSQKIVEDPLVERVNFHDQSSSEDLAADEMDEKYEEAIEIVVETRQASISMLQRRLRVGYNRAARMIEMMEQQGIVGASDGVKPREVFGRK